MTDLADAAHQLFEEQKRSWQMFRAQVELLQAAPVRAFDFGRFVIKAQLNVGRLILVSAKPEPGAVGTKKCFLCDENRPAEQRGVEWKDGFKILCNPAPILPEHFTIVQTEHVPQRILPWFDHLLELTKQMSARYTVFYNGPQSGASAPNHLHFQAGLSSYLPVDQEYENVKQPMGEKDDVRYFTIDGYLRRIFAFESNNPEALKRAFNRHYEAMRAVQPEALEPMMNLIGKYDRGIWRLIAFLRTKHRPSHYFAPEPARLMASPGSVDMGGVLVLPRKQDFDRIGKEDVAAIYGEVSLPDQDFTTLAPFPRGTISQ